GLAANRMNNLSVGIDAGNAANPVQITGGRFLQDHVAVVGIAAILRLSSFSAKFLNYLRKCHFVGFPDAHVDDFRLRMSGHRGALGSLDLLELVNGMRFTVLASANTLGEEILNIGF